MPDTALATAPLVDPEHPWLGLLSFGEEHTEYFFGRERELDDLFERVRRETLTILYGPSGLGKTSLLQAGLCPRLRSSGLVPVLIRLRYPGRAGDADAETPPPLVAQVVQAIAATLHDLSHPRAADLATALAKGSAPSLWELFHDPAWGLIGPRAPRLALLFDQFEEIFTLGEDEARARQDAAALREALADLVENRPPPALDRELTADAALAERFVFEPSPSRVLLVLREDYLARLERWRRDLPSLMRNRLELRLLSGPQALQAVLQPGRLGPHPLVSEAVGAAIVRTVAAVAEDVPLDEIDAVPPLLSLLCRELNERRLAAQAPEIASELVTSQHGDILQRYYDQCFADHPLAVRAVLEDYLLSPTGFRESPSFDTVDTELSKKGVTDSDVILDRLVNVRLITIESRAGQRRLELTHDVLAPLVKASRDIRHAEEEREKVRNEAEKKRQQQLELQKERGRAQYRETVADASKLIAPKFGVWAGSFLVCIIFLVVFSNDIKFYLIAMMIGLFAGMVVRSLPDGDDGWRWYNSVSMLVAMIGLFTCNEWMGSAVTGLRIETSRIVQVVADSWLDAIPVLAEEGSQKMPDATARTLYQGVNDMIRRMNFNLDTDNHMPWTRHEDDVRRAVAYAELVQGELELRLGETVKAMSAFDRAESELKRYPSGYGISEKLERIRYAREHAQRLKQKLPE